jgi:hypothetical protein
MKSFAPALTPVTASPRTGTGRLRVDVDPHVVSPAGNGIHDCRVMDMILGFFWCRNKATVSGRHRENLYKSLLKPCHSERLQREFAAKPAANSS